MGNAPRFMVLLQAPVHTYLKLLYGLKTSDTEGSPSLVETKKMPNFRTLVTARYILLYTDSHYCHEATGVFLKLLSL
jgi:hypothetical protein